MDNTRGPYENKVKTVKPRNSRRSPQQKLSLYPGGQPRKETHEHQHIIMGWHLTHEESRGGRVVRIYCMTC